RTVQGRHGSSCPRRLPTSRSLRRRERSDPRLNHRTTPSPIANLEGGRARRVGPPRTGAPMHPSFHRLMPVARRPELVMSRGDGSYLWDDRGQRYLDFIQGWAVNSLGHAPPELASALSAQSARLLTPSPAFYTAPLLDLAERLVRSSRLHQVQLCSPGPDAN